MDTSKLQGYNNVTNLASVLWLGEVLDSDCDCDIVTVPDPPISNVKLYTASYNSNLVLQSQQLAQLRIAMGIGYL